MAAPFRLGGLVPWHDDPNRESEGHGEPSPPSWRSHDATLSIAALIGFDESSPSLPCHCATNLRMN